MVRHLLRASLIVVACTFLVEGVGAKPASVDAIPKFDARASCAAAAAVSSYLGRTAETCMGDENTARDTVVRNWTKYAKSDKSDCVGMVTQGGPPSWVELLSCLEMMADGRALGGEKLFQEDIERSSARRAHQK